MPVSFYTFYITNLEISRIPGNGIKSNNLGARGYLLIVKVIAFGLVIVSRLIKTEKTLFTE